MSKVFTKIPIGLFSPNRKKLKPIMSHKKLKINKTLSTYKRNQNYRALNRNMSLGELSVLLFQNNDVDLVRSLNPDQDRDICSNILLKGQLKNNINRNYDYDMKTIEPNSSNINLPKIKKITIKGIIESERKLNQNKKEAQKNLAYSQLEEELCTELKNIRNEYHKKKEEKNNIYIKFKNIIDKIEEMNLEIKLLNSRNLIEIKKENKAKQKEDRTINDSPERENKLKQNLIQKESSKMLQMTDLEKIKNRETEENLKSNRDDIENRMNKIKNIYQNKKEKDFQKKLLFDKINLLKEELSKINIPLVEINAELTELRKKEKSVINKLMIHYETLLYKGEEVRNEGLIWIIKAMWNLGENVPMSFIPPFLDFQCIEFLFQYAHKSIELENTKKRLNELKNNLQIQIHNLFYNSVPPSSPEKYKSSFEFKTNLIKNNKSLKKSIGEHNFINAYINGSDNDDDNQNINSVKEMSNLIANKKNNIDISKLNGIEKIDVLKLKIKEIEAEIQSLKKKETNRIFKEFIENDYQNKYHARIDIVLAALLGEHSKNIEVNKYSKFKKDYFDEIKNIRFYQYGQDKNSI